MHMQYLKCSPEKLKHDRGGWAHRCSPPRTKLLSRSSTSIAYAADALAPAPSVPELEGAPVHQLRAGKGSSKATLWGTSNHVHPIDVQAAESLYLSLCERSNDQHMLLVVYAPWCPHSRAVEHEVERLANGLSEASLRVVCLSVDSSAARYFAKDVLGLQHTPSFVLFPAGSRTFYKYKGKARDADSLLRFLNMVCNQNSDTTWQLNSQSSATAATTSSTNRAAAMSSIAPATFTSAGTAASQLLQGLGLTPYQVGLGGGLLLGAAGLGLLSRVLAGFQAEKARHAAAIAKADRPDQAVPQHSSDTLAPSSLVHEIDSSLSRMSSLMVQLMGARVGLSVAQLGAGATASDTAHKPALTTVDVDAVTTAAASTSSGAAADAAPVRMMNKAASIRSATVAAASFMTMPLDAHDEHEAVAGAAGAGEASAGIAAIELDVAEHHTMGASVLEEVHQVAQEPVWQSTATVQGLDGHQASTPSPQTSPAMEIVTLSDDQHEAEAYASLSSAASDNTHHSPPSDMLVLQPAEGRSKAVAELEHLLEEIASSGSHVPGSTSLPGQGTEARVTGEAARVTQALSADEVVAMLDAEGADVGKVLDRLAGVVAFEAVQAR